MWRLSNRHGYCVTGWWPSFSRGFSSISGLSGDIFGSFGIPLLVKRRILFYCFLTKLIFQYNKSLASSVSLARGQLVSGFKFKVRTLLTCFFLSCVVSMAYPDARQRLYTRRIYRIYIYIYIYMLVFFVRVSLLTAAVISDGCLQVGSRGHMSGVLP